MITHENANFGLYAVTDELDEDGYQVAQFVGYFLTREDMKSYAAEFTGSTMFFVSKQADGTWVGYEEDDHERP